MAKIILITTSQQFASRKDADLLFDAMRNRKPTTTNVRRIEEYDRRRAEAKLRRAA